VQPERPPKYSGTGSGNWTRFLNCFAVGLLIVIGVALVLALLVYAACGGFSK
jgi:hypothetical protein